MLKRAFPCGETYIASEASGYDSISRRLIPAGHSGIAVDECEPKPQNATDNGLHLPNSSDQNKRKLN